VVCTIASASLKSDTGRRTNAGEVTEGRADADGVVCREIVVYKGNTEVDSKDTRQILLKIAFSRSTRPFRLEMRSVIVDNPYTKPFSRGNDR